MQYACLAVAGAVAAVHLVGWLIPPVGGLLPATFRLMKANTAVAGLLSAVSLWFSQPRRSVRMLHVSRGLAVGVLLLAGLTLAEYLTGRSLGIDTLLAHDKAVLRPGRMSSQTSVCFTLLAPVMVWIRLRKQFAAHVVDGLAFVLSMIVLVMTSGYLFGTVHLFGLSGTARTSPQTLVCLILLSFVAFGRRAEYGVFSIMLGIGIGSKIARIACPGALLLPFLLEMAEASIIHSGAVSAHYAIALATAMFAMVLLALILVVCWRIDTLERAVRDLSLRDDLTKLYNRRGFYILAEQALHMAQRSQTPFSVLFIDLDNLKQINDKQGHDVGSLFLSEVADLLRASFREADVIGRIGGDEFVVAAEADEEGMRQAAQRLEDAAAVRNLEPGRRYEVSFSLGYMTTGGEWTETLDDLLDVADHEMYLTKRRKKLVVG